MCAVSHRTSDSHVDAKLGDKIISKSIRAKLMREITEKFNYQLLIRTKPEYVQNLNKKFFYGYNFFKIDDEYWRDALYWQ